MKVHSHYDNLKVSRDAPPEVIRAAYKALCQKWHPDRNPSEEAAKIILIINAAYQILSDPDKRREHDGWLAHQEFEPVAPKLAAQATPQGAARPDRASRSGADPQARGRDAARAEGFEIKSHRKPLKQARASLRPSKKSPTTARDKAQQLRQQLTRPLWICGVVMLCVGLAGVIFYS